MKAAEALINHIQKFIHLTDDDATKIPQYFKSMTVSKKQNLVESGQTCKQHYFVSKGCLRMYFIDRKEVEQTTQFAIENWWITDHMSFINQKASEFTIQAVEKSDVLALSRTSSERLLTDFPQMERYFRIIYQRQVAANQLRTKYQHDYSKEESYHHFSQHFPEFIQRVPQYLLASYLGFTPEYLSEIRKKNVLKPV